MSTSSTIIHLTCTRDAGPDGGKIWVQAPDKSSAVSQSVASETQTNVNKHFSERDWWGLSTQKGGRDGTIRHWAKVYGDDAARKYGGPTASVSVGDNVLPVNAVGGETSDGAPPPYSA